MKTTKIASLFFLVAISYTQCRKADYLNYYSKINQAELYINRLEFDSALVVYESLFRSYSNHFYKDLHNTCLCYLKTNKLDKAEYMTEQLVLHGYELDDFKKDSTFNFLMESPYVDILQKKYTTLHGKYLETLNYNFRKTLYLMSLKDQKAASSQKMNFQDSTFYYQAIELEKLFNHYGFSGCMKNKDTLNSKMWVMIRHYLGLVNRTKSNPEMLKEGCYKFMNFSKINLRCIVDKGLKEGLIMPQTYIGMVSYFDNSNPYGNICVKVDFDQEKVTLILNLPPEKVIAVNRNRNIIGLPEISFTNPDVLNNTWYSKYPFKLMKEALLACDSCTTYSDYMTLIANEELKVSNIYNGNPVYDGFILTDHSSINCTFLEGVNKYYKNIKKH